MKIAVCMSGEPRTFAHTYDSVRKYFMGHEVDFFLHTWETDATTQDALLKAYSPVAYCFEKKPDFSDFYRKVLTTFGTDHFSFLYIIDMFRGVSMTNRLKIQHEHEQGIRYDLVVRTRYDMLMDGVLDCSALNRDAITIPAQGNCKDGYNDRFAIGPSHLMNRYAELYMWLHDSVNPDLYTFKDGYHPEPVLAVYLNTVAKVQVKTHPFAAKLLRPHQIGRPFPAVNEGLRVQHHSVKLPLLEKTLKDLGFK